MQSMPTIPFGESFNVLHWWKAESRKGSMTDHGIHFKVFVRLDFIKKTFFSGQITSSTIKQAKPASAQNPKASVSRKFSTR